MSFQADEYRMLLMYSIDPVFFFFFFLLSFSPFQVATTGTGLVEVADQCLKLRRLLVIGFFDLTNVFPTWALTRVSRFFQLCIALLFIF